MNDFTKREFIEALAIKGDRLAVCEEMRITTIDLQIHSESDADFAAALRTAERTFSDNLKRIVEGAALRQLAHVLKHGITTVTTTTETNDIYAREGGYGKDGEPSSDSGQLVKVGEKVTTKETIKRERHVGWAIKEGLKMVAIREAKESILDSLQNLVENGIMPEDSETLISGLMSDFQSQVKAILSGNVDTAEVTTEQLARIQQAVIR
jgi:hypothetical protein